jgi:hypothetical protein
MQYKHHILLAVFTFTTIFGFSQIILSNDYKCVFSEIPFRGSGLTNGKFTFYVDASSRDYPGEEDQKEFLLNFKKTKDNLYYDTGYGNESYYYRIVIPESFFVVSLTSTSNNELFKKYSTALLDQVRKVRNGQSETYFIRKNRVACVPKID